MVGLFPQIGQPIGFIAITLLIDAAPFLAPVFIINPHDGRVHTSRLVL
jgi:hypothetical protein